MLAALLLGGVGTWRQVAKLPPRGADARRLLLALVLLTFVLLPAAASCLLVFPRLHYLMPSVTLVLALAASNLPGRRFDARPALLALAAALVLLTPNRAGRPWDAQSWLRRRPRRPLPC